MKYNSSLCNIVMKYDSPNMIEVYTDLYLTCKHVI